MVVAWHSLRHVHLPLCLSLPTQPSEYRRGRGDVHYVNGQKYVWHDRSAPRPIGSASPRVLRFPGAAKPAPSRPNSAAVENQNRRAAEAKRVRPRIARSPAHVCPCKEHVQRACAKSTGLVECTVDVGVTTGVVLGALTCTIVRCVVRSAVASTVVWPLTGQHDDASAVHAVGQSRASGHRPGRRRRR